VLLGRGDLVVVEVVDGKEVARREVNVELLRELAGLLRRAAGRGEEENIAILVEELGKELRGEVGAVTCTD
jgi:hypothetical protein